ncbi:hypothetical protein PsYK624_065180 [Phanerochaete sordida]|uniref:Uncharacterized protein n=1 Tax=Phanerochaete sordida TaxID=48140 RepID=A0A9P3LDX4_9APHY|nr:hypothetical protein PsYK624_065180 [Phanerochaete sordida]
MTQFIQPQQLVDASAGTIYVLFGPDASTTLRHDDIARVPSSAVVVNSGAMQELLDAARHLHIVVHASTPLFDDLRRFDIARHRALRTLKAIVVYDTADSPCIVRVWRSILAMFRSMPDTAALEDLTLTSPVPLASLRSGWSRSILVAGLRQPLYSIDHLLVRAVDRTVLDHITLVPPPGETFISVDWARARSFFPALYDYGMLHH